MPNYTASSAKFPSAQAGMTKILVNPTQVRDHQSHPVQSLVTRKPLKTNRMTSNRNIYRIWFFRLLVTASKSVFGSMRIG